MKGKENGTEAEWKESCLEETKEGDNKRDEGREKYDVERMRERNDSEEDNTVMSQSTLGRKVIREMVNSNVCWVDNNILSVKAGRWRFPVNLGLVNRYENIR